MQGLEDELIERLHNQNSTRTPISQGDRTYFAISHAARQAQYLVNSQNEVLSLTDELKRLKSPNADTNVYALSCLIDLHKEFEQAHINFADRKLSKYNSLLRKFLKAICKNDKEVAQQCYDSIKLLKSASDPRMQTLSDRISKYDTLNMDAVPTIDIYNSRSRRKRELEHVISILRN